MKTHHAFALIVVSILLSSCTTDRKAAEGEEVQEIFGEAQGTTYSIRFLNPQGIEIHKSSVDSILEALDLSLSTWVPQSVISGFNRTDSLLVTDPHFITVFERGKELSHLTDGAFHPMVAPLVRAWGFGPEGGKVKDGLNIDSLKQLVTYDFEVLSTGMLGAGVDEEGLIFIKPHGVQIDVNSYAQGYSVDVLVDYLRWRGIENMMVEIGGELAARGVNSKGEPWRIGIDKPVSAEAVRELQATVALQDAAMATSGTYRKFYEKDGKKYSHTIDPKTGGPVDHNLLSVTVRAPNCTNADAMATAFLVMGVEETKSFLQKHPGLKLEVYLIFDNADGTFGTYTSEGWKDRVEEL